MASSIKYDDSGFKNVISALKKDYFVRIGIIGSKAGKVEHEGSELTNAELGTIHEFGGKSKHGKEQPPRRSFLEDSLKFKLKIGQERFKYLRTVLFKSFFVKNAPQQFMKKLGETCFQIIMMGFDTNGYGMWKPLSMPVFKERFDKAWKNYRRIEGQMYNGKRTLDKKMLDEYFDEAMHPRILQKTGKLKKSISFKVMRNK